MAFILLEPELKDVFDLTIFVDTTIDVLEFRWFDRAMHQERFKKDPGAARLLFKDALSKAYEHILPRKFEADLMLNGNLHYSQVCYALSEKLSTF